MNTRDELHDYFHTYRRIHVIVGNANMSETAIYLKVGTAGIVLEMIADGMTFSSLELSDPVGGMKAISPDLRVTAPVSMANEKASSASEI